MVERENEDSFCCGGSLGVYDITLEQRDAIRTETVELLTASHPDLIASACPLCKKTLSKNSPVKVLDIAEIVAGEMIR